MDGHPLLTKTASLHIFTFLFICPWVIQMMHGLCGYQGVPYLSPQGTPLDWNSLPSHIFTLLFICPWINDPIFSKAIRYQGDSSWYLIVLLNISIPFPLLDFLFKSCFLSLYHPLRWIKQWILSERPITICTLVKTWLSQGSQISPNIFAVWCH